jgi:hypothetical protein
MRLTAGVAKSPGRMTSAARTQRRIETQFLPIPTGGLDAVSKIDQMPPDRALRMDNWFPQLRYIEVRRGHTTHCDTGVAEPVESLMAYNAIDADDDALFAAAGDTIYDVTTSTPSASQTGLLNARWQHVNFGTSGGNFLWICNGANDARYWDGSTWTTASITGDISASDVVDVTAYKNRLWLTPINDRDAYYLAGDSIQGAATAFPLGGVFQRGGYLQAIATWSRDGGDGPDDNVAFISSKGDVAIYTGTDPASDFALTGLYQVGAPIGRRCWRKVGGDIALICQDGVINLLKAVEIDRAAFMQAAITAIIQPLINDEIRNFSDQFGWQLMSYPRGTRAILNVPQIEGEDQLQYVMNTVSGAWCRFTGQKANVWELFQDRLYFGGNDGVVYEADRGGTDGGEAIVTDVQPAFTNCGSPLTKTFSLVRPFLNVDAGDAVTPAIAVNVDYRDTASLNPTEGTVPYVAQWDEAVWDEDVWPSDERMIANWLGVSARTGAAVSVRMQTSTLGDGGQEFVLQLRALQIAYTTSMGGIL